VETAKSIIAAQNNDTDETRKDGYKNLKNNENLAKVAIVEGEKIRCSWMKRKLSINFHSKPTQKEPAPFCPKRSSVAGACRTPSHSFVRQARYPIAFAAGAPDRGGRFAPPSVLGGRNRVSKKKRNRKDMYKFIQ